MPKPIKKTKPTTMKSSGTDDPKKYVGGWESYNKPQGINDRQDRKVMAMEDFSGLAEMFKESNSLGPDNSFTRFAPEPVPNDYIVGPEEEKAIKQSRKAPMKSAKRKAMAFSARGQKVQLEPRKVTETIRRPLLGTLSNEYEIIDDDEKPVGYAKVREGIISTLDYVSSASQEYRGQILSAMLHQIVTEADRHNANLSVQVNNITGEVKTLLERFGFRRTMDDVMKRNYGGIHPTSVPSVQGMVNRDD